MSFGITADHLRARPPRNANDSPWNTTRAVVKPNGCVRSEGVLRLRQWHSHPRPHPRDRQRHPSHLRQYRHQSRSFPSASQLPRYRSRSKSRAARSCCLADGVRRPLLLTYPRRGNSCPVPSATCWFPCPRSETLVRRRFLTRLPDRDVDFTASPPVTTPPA